mmetsp:Transcript_17571/g.48586  ORF Transcript_17571/g.48586 Transcript_17571/m.48586 type:complete len:227 (-) Transcript_17571:7856-8536(-)
MAPDTLGASPPRGGGAGLDKALASPRGPPPYRSESLPSESSEWLSPPTAARSAAMAAAGPSGPPPSSASSAGSVGGVAGSLSTCEPCGQRSAPVSAGLSLEGTEADEPRDTVSESAWWPSAPATGAGIVGLRRRVTLGGMSRTLAGEEGELSPPISNSPVQLSDIPSGSLKMLDRWRPARIGLPQALPRFGLLGPPRIGLPGVGLLEPMRDKAPPLDALRKTGSML